MKQSQLLKNILRFSRLSRHHRKSSRVLTMFMVAIIFLGLLSLITTPTAQEAISQYQPGLYEVIDVNDGDTITVNMNGDVQTIRLIGIDTPETHHPSKPVQCFGEEASRFTGELIAGQPVRLEADPESDNRDRYARLLRYVYLPDGTFVNAEVVSQGYGFAPAAFPHTFLSEFEQLEAEARESQRGLWNSCEQTINDYGSYETEAADAAGER